jgi:hypothetical protein
MNVESSVAAGHLKPTKAARTMLRSPVTLQAHSSRPTYTA